MSKNVKPWVIIEISRSSVIENFELLIVNKVVTFDVPEEFSDDLKTELKYI